MNEFQKLRIFKNLKKSEYLVPLWRCQIYSNSDFYEFTIAQMF